MEVIEIESESEFGGSEERKIGSPDMVAVVAVEAVGRWDRFRPRRALSGYG